MKTTILLKSHKSNVENQAETLSQLRSIKQAGAFLLLLFAALFFALFMSSCGDDKNKDDLDLDQDPDLEFMEENTTLSVSGEVNGNFKAFGQVVEHFNNETQLYLNSFHFLENDDVEISKFNITISRFANTPLELSEQQYTIDNSYMEEEAVGFSAVVMWWDDEENATAYSPVENSTIKIEKVTNTEVTGEFKLNLKTVGYDENQPSLSISGSFKIPRIKF